MLQLEETEGHQVYLYVVNPLLAQKLEAMVGQAGLSREVGTWSYTADSGVFNTGTNKEYPRFSAAPARG